MGTSDRSLWWQEGTEQAVLFSWAIPPPAVTGIPMPQIPANLNFHWQIALPARQEIQHSCECFRQHKLNIRLNPCLYSQADVLRCDRQVITHNIQYSSKFQLIAFKSNLVLQMTGSAALQKAAESLLRPDYFKDRGVYRKLQIAFLLWRIISVYPFLSSPAGDPQPRPYWSQEL